MENLIISPLVPLKSVPMMHLLMHTCPWRPLSWKGVDCGLLSFHPAGLHANADTEKLEVLIRLGQSVLKLCLSALLMMLNFCILTSTHWWSEDNTKQQDNKNWVRMLEVRFISQKQVEAAVGSGVMWSMDQSRDMSRDCCSTENAAQVSDNGAGGQVWH